MPFIACAFGHVFFFSGLKRSLNKTSPQPFIIASSRISSELGKIKAPLFVVAGAQDLIFTTELADEIAEKTGAEEYIYPNYGHSAYDEAPDFLDRVWNFFKPTTSSF